MQSHLSPLIILNTICLSQEPWLNANHEPPPAKGLTCSSQFQLRLQPTQSAPSMSANPHNCGRHSPSSNQTASLEPDSSPPPSHPPLPPSPCSTSTPPASSTLFAMSFTPFNRTQTPSSVATSTYTTGCGAAMDPACTSDNLQKIWAWRTP